MKRILCFALPLFCSLNLTAQQVVVKSSSDILLSLQKLNTIGSVLYIAAHPDDENTRLLSYLSREKKVRTGYLSLTRGDGGQNLIGKEQGAMLGLIRTQELLEARRVDEAEQFFTRAFDFGYSKTPEETFDFWNYDSILSDVVWVIRKFKPDIIICRFPTSGEGGHGHHTASAILASQAFEDAANPAKFSWQLRYTKAWQSRSIFWNTFNFGTVNTTSENQLKIDVGLYNPLLGKGYGEIAAESRSMHKSQGFGTAKQRGKSVEYFKWLKGDSTKKDLFENIDLSWKRVDNSLATGLSINQCIEKFNPLAPEKSLDMLIHIAQMIESLPGKDPWVLHWKKIKLKEVNDLIVDCSGLWVECIANDYMVVPGSDFLLSCEVINRNSASWTLKKIQFDNLQDTTLNTLLQYNENKIIKHRYKVHENTSYSNPYWLNKAPLKGNFIIENRLQMGQAENTPAITIKVVLQYKDYILIVEKPVVYKSTDPVKGESYRPLEILPPVTLNFAEHLYVITDNEPKLVDITIKANTDHIKGVLEVNLAGFDIGYNNSVYLAKKGDEMVLSLQLKRKQQAVSGNLYASLKVGDKNYNYSIDRVNYDHIPAQFVLKPAETKILNLQVKKGGTTIGYINGAGDDVSNCLKQVGYKVSELSDKMIENESLSAYDAIITGIRAYNINERLQIYHPKLMEYVKNGGNLIVQYNTNNRIGPVKAAIGPYPFTISRNRVTDEHASVNILDDKHPVFNFPNKIEAKNFENWIQERGIYFATEFESNYTPLLSMHDRNEEALNGSLIVTPYGKGNFVYTGLAFFRELPAGVEGAFPLFINLLSIPKN